MSAHQGEIGMFQLGVIPSVLNEDVDRVIVTFL